MDTPINQAAQTATTAAADAAHAGGGLAGEFLSRFSSGHFLDLVIMWGLTIMFFVSLAIIAERVYMLLFRYNTNAATLMQKVQRLIMDNNIEEAVRLCSGSKDSVLHQIFKAGLVNAHRSVEEIQDYIEVAKLGVIPKLQKRLSYLFMMGNVATLMGLLGTVFGLVVSFSGAKTVEASQKQMMLTAGISSALTATFFGLMVAIPCMFFYGFLFNRVNHMIDEIEHYSARLIMLLRTGSEYFEKFNPDAEITTAQSPRKETKEEKDAA
jgi:biopolymer transport protein ExbB